MTVPNDPLRIERAIMPDVNLSSYSYDVDKRWWIFLWWLIPFRSVAQQIVTLKQRQCVLCGGG